MGVKRRYKWKIACLLVDKKRKWIKRASPTMGSSPISVKRGGGAAGVGINMLTGLRRSAFHDDSQNSAAPGSYRRPASIMPTTYPTAYREGPHISSHKGFQIGMLQWLAPETSQIYKHSHVNYILHISYTILHSSCWPARTLSPSKSYT